MDKQIRENIHTKALFATKAALMLPVILVVAALLKIGIRNIDCLFFVFILGLATDSSALLRFIADFYSEDKSFKLAFVRLAVYFTFVTILMALDAPLCAHVLCSVASFIDAILSGDFCLLHHIINLANDNKINSPANMHLTTAQIAMIATSITAASINFAVLLSMYRSLEELPLSMFARIVLFELCKMAFMWFLPYPVALAAITAANVAYTLDIVSLKFKSAGVREGILYV
ncbi:hypothetical protein Q7P37_000348 [Cladosporium fusiforme]